MKKILPLVLFSMLIFTGFSVRGSILFQDDNQNAVVNGQVKDDVSGEGLPGVTVMIEGTTIGTTTDFDGKYSLQVPNPESAVLVFSYLGYHTEKVSVNNQTTINFSLVPKIEELDELVVVGYGVQKRSNVTGAISSVKVENMENKPITRLDQALQGMSSGVTVTQNGGSPGAEPTIHIRGIGSIGNTKPLWIVDGVRMEPGNHFDPDDIESIEILKDAASSAIYGIKAAHGVILVTTKRGKGKTSFNFNSSLGQRQPINLPQLLNSADYVAYKKQSRINAGQDPDPSWDNYEHDTDWLDSYYAGKGTIQSNNLSLSKGEKNYNMFLSLGYDNEKGILIDNTYKRLSGRINSDIRITNWLKIGESVLLSKVIENPIGNFNASSDGAIPYRSIPLAPIYDENNPFGGWGEAPGYFGGPNPVASQYQQHEKRIYNRLDGNLYAEITPLKGLMVKGTVGYNQMGFFGERFDEAFDYGIFANPISSLTYSSSRDESVLGNVVASYERTLGGHYVKLMAGFEASQIETNHFNLTGTDFPVSTARSMGLATGIFTTTDKANIYQWHLYSQFGRLNYNYKERYLFEANIRRDASAPKFAPENVLGIFPSFSAGWNVSKEKFFQNIPILSSLKIRGSTGELGSDNLGDFIWQKTYLSRFATYSYAPGGEKNTGFYISKFPNAEVGWEKVNMHNVGIDLTAFRNKLSFSVDYYIKDTKDLLYQVPIPPSVGLSVHNQNTVNPELNIGTLRNTGLDFEVGYTTQYKKFNLNVNGNTSFIKNEMKSLENQVITGGSAGTIMGGMTRTEAGHPISSFYGYIVQGMFNSERDVYAYNSYATDGFYQEAQTGPGDLIYKDISGPEGVPDGQITAEHDRTFIGNPWPKMTYALNITVEWNKLIDISLQFQGVQGVDVFNGDKAYRRNFFGDNNTTTDIYEAWTPENPTNHPRNIAIDPNGNFSKPSTYFVEDGSYLKLRNAQIGVNVPQSILSQLKIQKLRIYVNANNFLTFTKYSGNDPEIAGNNTSRGVDYGVYPMVRTISGGLQLQF